MLKIQLAKLSTVFQGFLSFSMQNLSFDKNNADKFNIQRNDENKKPSAGWFVTEEQDRALEIHLLRCIIISVIETPKDVYNQLHTS